ncbi:MAG: photosystem II protein PsbQ [Xenococcaceae cyanobacterium MO_207.B15]|nr:photosystem II protein PsbQ [Xenococcaceae cyanobacterium MO_207.B15]MDJ0742518.1 photosystem II protein PsbQ [Xenococcaceae cyanobacterium MO_167.B27]
MKIFRSVLSLMLVLVATVLVSCGSPQVSAPPTYTPEKLQVIKTYRIPVDVARDKMNTLGEFIRNEDWVNVKSFIHGPLGFLRRDFRYLSDALLPDDKAEATELAKDIFTRLENIDVAAEEKDYKVAKAQFNQALDDFEAYIELIPEA